MELKDAVIMFATECFHDVFNVDSTVLGKIAPFAEVANSGAASQRRILETPPCQVIPESYVIQSESGEKYIVADVNVDYWDGEKIRLKYPILPVDYVGSVGTIGEVLSSTQPDTEVYSYPYFVRREADDAERSDYLSGYEVYFPPTKSFLRGVILLLNSVAYRIQIDTQVDGAGFVSAQCVKIENPLQVFDVKIEETYDPATDKYGTTTIPDVQCFVEPLRLDYEFVSPSFTDIEVGDKAISLISSDIKVNDRIGPYRVLSVRTEGTWATCQCRNLS